MDFKLEENKYVKLYREGKNLIISTRKKYRKLEGSKTLKNFAQQNLDQKTNS
jgi:hypothetical protein